MIRVLDNEGEREVTLTDVNSYQELRTRLRSEEARIMELLGDTPFFGYYVCKDQDQYDDLVRQTGDEYIIALVEDPSDPFPDDLKVTQTYEEWMSGCRQWAQSYLEELDNQ